MIWTELTRHLSPTPILPSRYNLSNAYTFNLSSPSDFHDVDPTDVSAMVVRTQKLLNEHHAIWGIGLYEEKRALYVHDIFEEDVNIHLGLDLCVPAKTPLYCPIDATVHSFADNNSKGDFGPTLILRHEVKTVEFYTLYGHLSPQSLRRHKIGKKVLQGKCLGTVGTPENNGGWPSHLHWQVILDIGDNRGNYHGVCNEADKEYYLTNCPNPAALLRFHETR